MQSEGLDLILMFSLGRSGSTFLAKAIAENSDYANAGENRYFWQELVKLSQGRHPAEIERFFSEKTGGARKVLDKTPDLYRHIGKINFGSHRVECIELVRGARAIAASRVNFVSALRKPSRWKIRIRNYRRDYGSKWFIPILQRWYLLPALLGIGKRRAFATGISDDVDAERGAFDAKMEKLRGQFTLITIDYDDFDHTADRLQELGLSHDQTEEIKKRYRR